MDTAQWPQGIGIVEQQVDHQNSRPVANVDKKPRPPKEQAVNCPRCNSTNTKFCYYNNYSLSQPRYLCKTCRRYWTDGGSLRNVPVGGGSRKNKRPHSSNNNNNNNSSSNTSKKIHPDLSPTPPQAPTFAPHQNPKVHQGQDLNLAYNPFHINGISEFSSALQQVGQNPNDHHTCSSSSQFSMMELLKSGGNNSIMSTSRGLSSFMSDHANPMFSSSGFQIPAAVHDDHDQFKPSLSFTLDGLESNYGSLQGLNLQNASSRVVVPFEELKSVPAANEFHEQDKGQGEGNGYWNGMLAGGSW